MDSVSPVHWLITFVILAVPPAPAVIRILSRTGLSGWWTALFLLPVISWIVLWVFAYAKWPRLEGQAGVTVA